MKILKSFILFTILTFALSVGVAAKEDTHRASVEKLLVLSQQDRLYEQVFPQMKQMVLQQLQQMNISQEQSPVVEKYLNKMFDVVKDEMSWDKMKGDFIRIYMSVYTEEEVRGLISFYKSPLGKKMIEKTPQLMEQSMAVSQKYVITMMPKIQKITEEMVTELLNEPKNGKK